MKIYDFKNKKLYESNAVYTLSVEEFDADGNSIDQNSFEDTYSTLNDALEDSYELMTNCAAEEGYDEDDVEYTQNDDNVVFTTPDGKKWIFTATVSNNESEIIECGDTNECENTNEEVVIPVPYAGNSTTTQDVKPSNTNYKRFTINDAEAFWEAGVLPEFLNELDANAIYSYFKDDMLDKLVVAAPEANGRVYPQNFKIALSTIIKMFTIDGLIDAEYFNDAVADLIQALDIDIDNPTYGNIIDAIDDLTENVYEENKNESVAERFSRLRKMFESEEDDEEDVENSDDNSDDEGTDEDDKDDEGSDSDEDNKDDEKSEDDDDLMKAVIITVKKGDEEKCKEEMIDAGIADDDIEILDADDDVENVEIRIDVNSIMELKDYLNKKGIDLEEEIGGEIVSDDEEDSDKEDSDDENGDDENKEGDDEDFDFDNIGDLFGAEETEE